MLSPKPITLCDSAYDYGYGIDHIIPTLPKLTVLDTFAGAGGFSLGFEMADCKIIGGIEIDKWASNTFQANHPNATVIQEDIQNIGADDLERSFKESPNILLGSPPCQGFSICNTNSGDPKDPRNSLFKDFIRVTKILEPSFVIMENVPNLIKARTFDKNLVIDLIRQELERIGYNVYIKILHAADYGIPQIRKRLFVIGSKNELNYPFPKPTHDLANSESPYLFENERLFLCPTLWDAISDLPVLNAGEGEELTKYTKEPVNSYQVFLRNTDNILHNHVAMKHTKRVVARFASMKWGHSLSDVPDHLKPRKRNSTEISGKVYDQNNRRLHPGKPCHTIPASFYANFVHPYSHRNFTAREGARIQSFPDNYVFKGKPTLVSRKLLAREGRNTELHLCQYNQIGNAVPPLLARAIAVNLLKQV